MGVRGLFSVSCVSTIISLFLLPSFSRTLCAENSLKRHVLEVRLSRQVAQPAQRPFTWIAFKTAKFGIFARCDSSLRLASEARARLNSAIGGAAAHNLSGGDRQRDTWREVAWVERGNAERAMQTYDRDLAEVQSHPQKWLALTWPDRVFRLHLGSTPRAGKTFELEVELRNLWRMPRKLGRFIIRPTSSNWTTAKARSASKQEAEIAYRIIDFP